MRTNHPEMPDIYKGVTVHQYGREVRCESPSKDWVCGYMQCLATASWISLVPFFSEYKRKFFVESPDGTEEEIR